MDTKFPTISPNILKSQPDQICVICRYTLNEEKICKETPCGHRYHADC